MCLALKYPNQFVWAHSLKVRQDTTMDNLEYIIAVLRVLAYDYQIIHTECRVSGSTIYLLLETRQARPGAPSLQYFRERLQIPAPSNEPQGLPRPRIVPLPPPVATTVVRPIPIIPPALLRIPPPPPGVPPPPGMPVPPRFLPLAPLTRTPISFLREDWHQPLPTWPLVPFTPPLGLAGEIPALAVSAPCLTSTSFSNPFYITTATSIATSTGAAPIVKVSGDSSPSDLSPLHDLVALVRNTARVPPADTSARTPVTSGTLDRYPELRAIIEKRPRTSVLSPSGVARATDNAPVTRSSSSTQLTGALAKFETGTHGFSTVSTC